MHRGFFMLKPEIRSPPPLRRARLRQPRSWQDAIVRDHNMAPDDSTHDRIGCFD